MRSDVIVVISPECQLAASIVQAIEQLLIQKLIPQAAVKAILLWLPRVDTVPIHIVIASPLLDLSRFRSVSLNGIITIKENSYGTQTQ